MNKLTESSLDAHLLSTIERPVLTPIVRAVLNSDSAELIDWRHDRIHGGAGDVGSALSSLHRFTGAAHDKTELDKTTHDSGGQRDWSLVLKVVGTTDPDQTPSEPRYWKREVLAYQSGELADLPGGLAAPHCYGIHQFSDEIIGLWLEDLADDVGPSWPLSHYGVVARHLGQFNGAYLTADTLPDWPWLSRGWVREHVNSSAPAIEQLRQIADRPEIQGWFIDDDLRRHLRFWDERERYLNALDCLPQSFLHRDAFRRNLFARDGAGGRAETVAVDWAFVGIGGIGEELASLVQGTLWFSEVSMVDAIRLEQIVLDGYLAGLADAGWRGDADMAWLGYAAGSALIFGLGYWAAPPDESLYPWIEQAFGLPIDEFRALVAALTHFRLDLVDGARQLIGSL